MMTPAQAQKFRTDHDSDARYLTRQTKAKLQEFAAARRVRIFGRSSKGELISELLNARYPLADLNQAIHVLHHQPGEAWSACDWCSQTVADAMHTIAGA